MRTLRLDWDRTKKKLILALILLASVALAAPLVGTATVVDDRLHLAASLP